MNMNTVSPYWTRLTRSTWKSLWKWFVAGYLIRLAFMPIASSVDQTVLLWETALLAKTGMLVPSGDWPPIFYILTPFLRLFSIIDPASYSNIFQDVLNNQRYSPFIASLTIRLSQPGINLLLLITKIPYLAFDLATAFLLLHMIDDIVKASRAFKLWMLNPIAIYVSYALGDYDIIVTFLLLLAVYLYKQNKSKSSALSIGISAAFKPIGLIFAVMLAVFHSRKAKTTLEKSFSFTQILFLGAFPAAIMVGFLLFSTHYYESANAAWGTFEYFNGYFGTHTFVNGMTVTSAIPAGLTLVGLEFPLKVQLFNADTLYFLPALAMVFLLVLSHVQISYNRILAALTSFLLLYYAFSHFHAQWFLWVQPLIILFAADKYQKFLKPYLLALPLFFVYTWQWDPLLSSALFLPIAGNAWSWPYPSALLESYGIPSVEFIDVLRSVFSVLLAFIALLAFDLDSLIRQRITAATSST